ncbi:MAG TPA: FAD-dependent oxidoreductase [Nitrospirota bacterium]|nr:FAD-dependent oxidoreductase [Nitrospirota bacterium]
MGQRVVIIGGGFGGLEAAFLLKELLGQSGSLTLVDRNAFHYFIPSIHEIVSGKSSVESIRIPFAAMLVPAGIRFIQDEVLSLSKADKEVICRDRTLPYDYLIVSTGAENNYFGIPGAEEFSFCFRKPVDAERIRTEAERLLEDPTATCRIVLAGGGTEGVEAAGELLDLVKRLGREDDLKKETISIDLIEGKERLLTGFPPQAQEYAENYLREHGANVVTGHPIIEVRNDCVVLEGEGPRASSVLVWTGGIQPAKMIRDLPLQKDPRGWLRVTDRLHSPDDDRIFGIGDAVSVYNQDGPLLLQRLAYHAQNQASIAALNIANRMRGRDMVVYTPKSRPQLISIGKDMGIFSQGDSVLTGAWVVVLKKAVERKHIMSCLTRPLTSSIQAWLPGAGFVQRLRMHLPF